MSCRCVIILTLLCLKGRFGIIRLEHLLVLVLWLQLTLLSRLATQASIHPKLLSSRSLQINILTLLLYRSHPLPSQVLNIPTKINKGTVEIITPVELIKKGDKVGSSEAALLSKLGIRPFSYGLVVLSAYDNGSVFSPEVLDLTDDDLVDKFAQGVSMISSLSLAISYPTLAAAPHMFINGYKNALAVAVETDYSFPLADKVKEYLAVRISFLLYYICI